MKANELPIINFLQTPNVQFVISVYQRNYDRTTISQFLIANLPKFESALQSAIKKLK